MLRGKWRLVKLFIMKLAILLKAVSCLQAYSNDLSSLMIENMERGKQDTALNFVRVCW
ncbi:MAG: hypothetical protein ACRC6K_00295 [Fusobacteriaceae bacterium]